MLDGPPIKMAILSKPNNAWVASESTDDQEAGQFIASIEDRIGARFSDISKGDEAVALMNPLIFAGTHIGQTSWTNDVDREFHPSEA